MKVVCIDNQKHPELEVNKIYYSMIQIFDILRVGDTRRSNKNK